jgi:hypothetical protein
MRMILVAMLMVAPAAVRAGDAPAKAPKPELERPATDRKPVDGKQVCGLVDRDPNAPSQRGDCVTEREPIAQRPVEKSPPGGPGNDATPSIGHR